jgi:2'-5' RNA ligase
MPFAITLRLDSTIASAVEEMWKTLAAKGIAADRYLLGYAPHITLAIYPDDAPSDALQAALRQVATHWKAMPVTLSGFGIFPAPTVGFCMVPVVTSGLLACYAALQAALPELEPHPHYRANTWIPHVTLSSTMRDPIDAIAALLPLWRPLNGFLDRADLMHFRPAEVLESYALNS